MKKRGRKSQARESEDEQSKPDKGVKRKRSQSVANDSEVVMDDELVGNMSKYRTVADWDHLVDTVDTVELADFETKKLHVYFRL